MRNITVLFLFFLLASPLGIVAQKKSGKKNRKDSKESTESAETAKSKIDDSRAEALFAEAMKYYILKDYGKALERFKEVEHARPKSGAVHHSIASSLYFLNRMDEAKNSAEKSIELEPTNHHYHQLLAEIYQEKRDFEKLIKTYETLIKLKPQDSYYYELASAYLYQGKITEAIRVYDDVEAQYGVNDLVIRQKQRLYLNQNQSDKAIKEGEKLLDTYPNVAEYAIEHARLLLACNKLDDAVKMLSEVEKNFPNDPHSDIVWAEIYKTKGDMASYYSQLSKAFARPEVDVAYKMTTLIKLLQSPNDHDDKSRSLELARIVSETHPDNAQAVAVYGDFLMSVGNFSSARDTYVRSVGLSGENFQVWEQIINLDGQLNQTDSLIRHSEQAMEYFPNQSWLYLINGTGHYMKKSYREAVSMFETGRRMANGRIIIEFDARLGDAYHNLREYAKSDASYEKALKMDGENTYVLNNFSYFLSLRKEKLEMAKQMGDKLVQLAPDNATYLDTYGWVLYVSGDFKKAKEYLEKAAYNSKNPVIIEHFGDALFKTGNKELALEQWQKALELRVNDDSLNVDNLKKKIEMKQLLD